MKRLAGAGLLVMQLLMFAGSTEGYVAAFALGLAGSTALVVSIGLRRNVPLWLSVPLAALLVWQVRVWGPIRLSPGQSCRAPPAPLALTRPLPLCAPHDRCSSA